MLTSKHDLPSELSQAELELEYINSALIAFNNPDLDLDVYIKVSKLSYNEVYNNETLYDLVDRLGSDAVEAYQGNKEL